MKKMVSNFFLCNLVAFGLGIVCELLFLGAMSFFVHSTFLYYFLRSVCIAASLPFCLYFICFEKNKKFKEFYVTCKNELHNSGDIGKKHFRGNAKFLAVMLFASVVILTAMPKHGSASSAELANSLDLYDDLINILLSSSSLFVEYLPELIFGKDIWIIRLSGALIWSVYFVLAYWFAMKVALRKWDRCGTENIKKTDGRKLLVISGLVFQFENWLVLIVDFIVSNSQNSGEGTSGWSKMLWSLLLITVFEALYLAEAIWAVAKYRSKFNVFKLCVVIISALLLMSLMYYGIVETIICNVFLVLLLIVEFMSLLKNKNNQTRSFCQDDQKQSSPQGEAQYNSEKNVMNSVELKARAKAQIAGKIGILFVITLIIGAISVAAGTILLLIPLGSIVASFIIIPAFSLSMARVYLMVIRGEKPEVAHAFCGFDDFFSAIKVSFLVGIYTFLWSLLFIIPGIVKGYSYSMSLYILADNKGKSARECIAESVKMTDGHKMELFVLQLSFIGWILLSTLISGILFIWVGPYMSAAYTNAYEALKPVAEAPVENIEAIASEASSESEQ